MKFNRLYRQEIKDVMRIGKWLDKHEYRKDMNASETFLWCIIVFVFCILIVTIRGLIG